MVFHSRSSPYWLLASLFLTGCLPSSCSRNEPRSITPADSLSREFAQTFPVDTLTVLEAINTGMDELQYPRTLAYDANGLLWVTDTARHILLAFESGFVEPVERDTIPDSFPYLAGFRAKYPSNSGATTLLTNPVSVAVTYLNPPRSGTGPPIKISRSIFPSVISYTLCVAGLKANTDFPLNPAR